MHWSQGNGDRGDEVTMKIETAKEETVLWLKPLRPERRILALTSDYDVVTMAPVSIAFTKKNLRIARASWLYWRGALHSCKWE